MRPHLASPQAAAPRSPSTCGASPTPQISRRDHIHPRVNSLTKHVYNGRPIARAAPPPFPLPPNRHARRGAALLRSGRHWSRRGGTPPPAAAQVITFGRRRSLRFRRRSATARCLLRAVLRLQEGGRNTAVACASAAALPRVLMPCACGAACVLQAALGPTRFECTAVFSQSALADSPAGTGPFFLCLWSPTCCVTWSEAATGRCCGMAGYGKTIPPLRPQRGWTHRQAVRWRTARRGEGLRARSSECAPARFVLCLPEGRQVAWEPQRGNVPTILPLGSHATQFPRWERSHDTDCRVSAPSRQKEITMIRGILLAPTCCHHPRGARFVLALRRRRHHPRVFVLCLPMPWELGKRERIRGNVPTTQTALIALPFAR